MSGFSLIWITNSFHMSWKYWVMTDYGKTKQLTLQLDKMPYSSGFLKYLQNYLPNWLEIFEIWFSNCLKAVLKKLLKINVRKALNHALSWMKSYRKQSPKNFFSFFFNNFSLFCHFYVVFTSKNHLF